MAYRINYHKVISQANDISNDAEQLSAQIKMLSKIEQDCRARWKGPAANVFIAKLSELQKEMGRTKAQISDLSADIRYCANRIQREDEEAERRAMMLRAGR